MNRLRRAIAGWRLGTRLFAAQAMVLVAIVATAGLTSAIIGPPLFHAHLVVAGYPDDSVEITHIERAYADANTISLAVALLVALVCALGVSWYLTRRIGRPVGQLTRAAQRVKHGDYAARVPNDVGAPELIALADSFNTMADRLGSVEQARHRLLADLAHEMRTPIATINAHLEGMSDGVLTWNDDTRRIIEQQAERLTRLARDLDEVSRAEEGRIDLDISKQGLADLIDTAVAQARRAFDAKGVSLSGVSAAVTVDADPQRIAQILGNLLNNALRHTPTGGRVTIAGTSSAHLASITVTDTGEGMTADQLGHIFERFYRGDAARAADKGGSGIGLTIAKAIAEAHQGSLAASSPGPGQGSTFTLTIPARP